MRGPHRRTLLLGALATAVAAPVLARHRWSGESDPTAGRPLELASGRSLSIPTPDGAMLAATDCGPEDGPLVVLAHGWTADRRVWAATALRLLADGHRIVAYDQRGHGESTIGTSRLTVDTLADDMRAVLDYLDAHDAVLVGHSLGGMAAQAFAIRHKDALVERVASLVLVSTAADRVVLRGPYRRFARWMAGSASATGAVGHPLAGPFLVRMTVGRRACLAHLTATAETFVATPAPVRAELLGAMIDLDLTSDLPAIAVPTVVISGTRDGLTLHRRSRTIAALIPGARLEALPGLGHQLVFEAPDRLAEVVAGCCAPSVSQGVPS